MKINSINIVSFGKLKNLKLDFSDNFTLIYGDNEAGKTHIADFIKLMFYGSGSRGTGVNNLRKKYKPWDSGKMGGSIDFTANGTNYRIEREFKASNSTDTIVLHNLDLGKSETLSGNENLGERFFSVSVDAFEQSMFIDNSVIFSGGSEELNLKLSNLYSSADEDVSFDKIIKNITNCRDSLISKNRKNGPIPETEAKIARLKEERLHCVSLYEKAEQLEKEKAEIVEKSAAANNRKNELFELLKSYEIHSLKEKLKEFKKAVEIFEKAESALKLSNGELADTNFLKNVEDGLNALKIKENEIAIKEDAISSDTKELATILEAESPSNATIDTYKKQKETNEEKISSLEKEINNTILKASEKKQRDKKPNLPLLIIGVLLLILGVVAGIFMPYLLAFIGVGVVFVALSFSLNKQNNEKENLTAKLEELKAEKEELIKANSVIEEEINEIIIEIKTNNSILLKKKEEALARRTELLELNQNYEKEKASVLSEISLFKPVFDINSAATALEELKELLNLLRDAKLRADMSIKGTGCRSTKEALAKLETLPETPEINTTREQLQDDFNTAVKVCSELQNRITALSGEISAITKNAHTPAEYEKAIEILNNKLENMKEFTEILDIANENLSEAYANQRSSWGHVLETRVLDIFKSLTDNAYSDMLISKDFEISVKKDSDITAHTAEYLSRGTFQQAYLALRLGLSEFLSKEAGSLPIVLDDAFSQSDDKRTAEGFRFLKEYSNNNQVIYFTCHKEIAKNFGDNFIALN